MNIYIRQQFIYVLGMRTDQSRAFANIRPQPLITKFVSSTLPSHTTSSHRHIVTVSSRPFDLHDWELNVLNSSTLLSYTITTTTTLSSKSKTGKVAAAWWQFCKWFFFFVFFLTSLTIYVIYRLYLRCIYVSKVRGRWECAVTTKTGPNGTRPCRLGRCFFFFWFFY